MNNRTIILGLGNSLRADEGFGVHLLKNLENLHLPPAVELVDGGTLGLRLLEYVERADNLLVLDAVDTGEKPGTVVRLAGENVKRYGRAKLSLHQLGFQEVLALAELRGANPRDIVVIGIQPQSLEWGCELTNVVKARIPEAIEQVDRQLSSWGYQLA